MNPLSADMVAGQYQIAVARRQLEAVEQEGKNAVELIHSASAPAQPGPPPNVGAGVGVKLNLSA